MEMRYALNDTRYVFYLDNKPMFETDKVAFLVCDTPSSLLVTHGPPASVSAMQNEMSKYAALSQTLGGEPATYHAIEGKFDVAGINQVIASSIKGIPFNQSLLVELA